MKVWLLRDFFKTYTAVSFLCHKIMWRRSKFDQLIVELQQVTYMTYKCYIVYNILRQVLKFWQVCEIRRRSSMCKHCWESLSWSTRDCFCSGYHFIIPTKPFQSRTEKNLWSKARIYRLYGPWYFVTNIRHHWWVTNIEVTIFKNPW